MHTVAPLRWRNRTGKRVRGRGEAGKGVHRGPGSALVTEWLSRPKAEKPFHTVPSHCHRHMPPAASSREPAVRLMPEGRLDSFHPS